MIFTHENTLRATVYDADNQLDMSYVLSVDTEAATVETAVRPICLDAAGGVATEKHQFRAIYPVRGGSAMVQLFLCYGKGEKPWA